MPNLRKARNGNGAHETGRIKKNCEFISPKLRIHFAKTVKSFRQNREVRPFALGIRQVIRPPRPPGGERCRYPAPSPVPATPYGAALRDSLGLIGPQRRLPAPLAAGTAHGLERLRHVARALFRKLPHRRLKHGPRDHKPPPALARLRLLRRNRERRPRSEVIDSGPAW